MLFEDDPPAAGSSAGLSASATSQNSTVSAFGGYNGADPASSSSSFVSANSSLRQTRLSFGPSGTLGLEAMADDPHHPGPHGESSHAGHHDVLAEAAALERGGHSAEMAHQEEEEVAPSACLLGANAACTTNVPAMQNFFAALHPPPESAPANNRNHRHHATTDGGPRMSQDDISSTDDETSNDSADLTIMGRDGGRSKRQIDGTRKRRSDGDQGGRGVAMTMDADNDDNKEREKGGGCWRGDVGDETTDEEYEENFHQSMRLGGGTSKNLAGLFGNAAADASGSAKVGDEEGKGKDKAVEYPTQQETAPSFFASVTAAAAPSASASSTSSTGGGTGTMKCSSPPRAGTTASSATAALAFGGLAAASGPSTSQSSLNSSAAAAPSSPTRSSANSFLSSRASADSNNHTNTSTGSTGITYGVNANGTAPKDGRYSFTASPIDETEEDIFRGVGNKVRRLNLGPDDASATSNRRSIFKKMKAEPSFSNGGFAFGAGAGGGDLSVHTSFGSGTSGGSKLMDAIEEEIMDTDDRISPTDVMSFPATSLDMSTAASGPPPKTPRSGRRNPVGVTNMMMEDDDDNEEAILDDGGADLEDATPAAPKISRSARASGGNKYNHVRPGTPTLEDHIATSTGMASPEQMGGCYDGDAAFVTTASATSPPRSMTSTSHTPHRNLGRHPATPVIEKRLVRRTPKVFTFQDEDTAGRRMGGGATPLAPPVPPKTPGSALGGVKRRSRFGDRDEDEMMETNQQSSAAALGRFETDFQIVGRPLGKGSFGTVYKCLSKVDGCTYGIKVANRRIKGVADRERMLKEVYALAALSDQADTAAFHIVRYHQAWMEEGRLHIQTELCTSTLQAELEVSPSAAAQTHQMQVEAPPLRQPMSHERRYKLLREILLALELIHKNNMCHLDIKPENIFIKTDQYKLGVSIAATRVPICRAVDNQ